MEKNMGKLDRIIRSTVSIIIAILGIVLIVMEYVVIGIVLIALAGILAVTSIYAKCPLYIPFRINTIGIPPSAAPVPSVQPTTVQPEVIPEPVVELDDEEVQKVDEN